MCDSDIVQSMTGRRSGLSRRDFAKAGALAGAGMFGLARGAEALAQGQLRERDVKFTAPGGQLDGLLIAPHDGKHPAVILWPDIAGIRDANLSMARQLAAEGYAVLIANPYYRSVEGQQFEDFDDWRGNDGMAKVQPWMAVNTPAAIAETHVAVVEWLDRQDEVDAEKGIGVQGFCMTGSWTIRAAAAVPARVKAAASFHGGGLVGEGADAPVNLLASMADDARALIAIARNDDARAPTEKDALRNAASAAGLDAVIEVYRADHGWTVPDSPAFDVDEADRAFAACITMFQAAL